MAAHFGSLVWRFLGNISSLPCPCSPEGTTQGQRGHGRQLGGHSLQSVSRLGREEGRVCQVTSVVSDSWRPHGLWPARLLCPWDSPGKNTGVGCHALLQGVFPTQGSSPYLLSLLHWQVSSFPLAPPGSLCSARGNPLLQETLFYFLPQRSDMG